MSRWIIGIVLFCLLAVGFWLVKIDVDVFNLLPKGAAPIEGLRKYQQYFGASRDLIISLRAEHGENENLEQLAESLAKLLDESSLVEKVTWRNTLTSDSKELGRFLAYQWMNQSVADFNMMTERFKPGSIDVQLESTLEQISSSFRPDQIARLTRDPFGLTEIAQDLAGGFAMGFNDPFASPDGKFRIIVVTAPRDYWGFTGYRHWVKQIRSETMRWRSDKNTSVTIRLSGNPAFIVEVGVGLGRDIIFAGVGTLIFVSFLFYWVHRRIKPLLWLTGLLVFTGIAALILTHIFFSPIHAISLAFAVILIGLATDYGLIVYQEKLVSADSTVAEQRRRVAPSILWASATTAAAFLVLSFSSLPGVQQLGVLVAIGILIAAFAMLWIFLPATGPASSTTLLTGSWIQRAPGITKALLISFGLFCLSISVLSIKLPSIDVGSKALGPATSESRDARQEVNDRISGRGVRLWVLLEATNQTELKYKLDKLELEMNRAVDMGLVDAYFSPAPIWPNELFQKGNLVSAGGLVENWEGVEKAARDAGFESEALELTQQVFQTWGEHVSLDRVEMPDGDFFQWLQGQYQAEGPDGSYALVSVQPAQDAEVIRLAALSEEIRQLKLGQLISWNLLAESLTKVMKRDVAYVLIPMGIVLVIMLLLTFRGAIEVIMSLVTLVFSVLLLSAFMVCFNWSWNLMNIMALPILLGVGVDYSIHIQLALKRFQGNIDQTRSHIGLAILLCGISTTIAFASLGFASNTGLASLGRVTALGVLITSLTAVYLLPAWWARIAPINRTSI